MRGRYDAVPQGQVARAGQLILIILALVIPLLVGVRLLPSPWLHDGRLAMPSPPWSRSQRDDCRNRDNPANGVRWAGLRAATTAYRAPTRRRPLFPRTVGVRLMARERQLLHPLRVRSNERPSIIGTDWPR